MYGRWALIMALATPYTYLPDKIHNHRKNEAFDDPACSSSRVAESGRYGDRGRLALVITGFICPGLRFQRGLKSSSLFTTSKRS